MKIDIICPLYNAENFIKKLNDSILKQKKIKINKIKYILTESKDNTEEILKNIKLNIKKYQKKNFHIA